ncbi:hypothetical protein BC832DRAFT_285 [Gaertneriomyces semiglobifer]|nr:hypothetical protein BC832DRAFT_285 [Gaertneriomyces semiglobifer]
MLARPQRGRAGATKTPTTPQQERYAFKYLRFRCLDINRTIEFYQSLGMSLDWQVEQVAQPMGTEKGKGAFNTVRDESKNDTSEKTTVFAMSYRVSGKDNAALNVQLLFEYKHSLDARPVSGSEDMLTEKLLREPLKGSTHLTTTSRNYEYLVIYVHFVHRLAKRLDAKGFDIVLAPLDIAEVKMCIVRDPNHLEIRLMELTDSQLNLASTRKQWYAKLGYYAIPTSQGEAAVRWYETLLGANRAKTAHGQRITTLDLANMSGRGKEGGGVGSKKKPGAAATVRQAITQGQGFRLVDTEEFVVGLSRSLYYWLGNDLRSATCTICFTEHADFGSSGSGGGFHRKDTRLLGLGFEVPNLDAATNQLRYEFKDELDWVHDRLRLQGIGTVAKLVDKINQTWIELFAQKGTEKETTRAGEDGEKGDGQGDRHGADIQYEIDFNHLKGQARALSAGAVNRVRRARDADIQVGQAAIMEASPSCRPSTTLLARGPEPATPMLSTAGSAHSSWSSLHMITPSTDDLRPHPPPGDAPTTARSSRMTRQQKSERQERYTFLNKPRSVSCHW